MILGIIGIAIVVLLGIILCKDMGDDFREPRKGRRRR